MHTDYLLYTHSNIPIWNWTLVFEVQNWPLSSGGWSSQGSRRCCGSVQSLIYCDPSLPVAPTAIYDTGVCMISI